MSLRSLIQQAASIAFIATGDLPIDVTIKSGPSLTHNPATDLTSTTWAHTTTVKALVYDEMQDEDSKREGPSKTTKTLLVKLADLPVRPDEQSKVTIDSLDWEVTDVQPDPAGATMEIMIRR